MGGGARLQAEQGEVKVLREDDTYLHLMFYVQHNKTLPIKLGVSDAALCDMNELTILNFTTRF